MSEAFIVGGVRTPIGNFAGALAPVRPDDLAALVLTELVKRSPKLSLQAINDVILGCANQSGEDNRNVARMALLLAGLPPNVPGETVNRLCASGLCAAANAARAIKTGEMELVIAGGIESMSRAPFVMAKNDTAYGRNVEMYDTTLGWRFVNPRLKEQYGTHSMGETAEEVAEQFKISRADQDTFAVRSQEKAAAAQASGRFRDEIVPVSIPQRKGEPKVVTDDEFIRPGTTLDILAKLKPAFRRDGKGSVTAGNSSGLNDGACALLVASEAAAKEHNLTPRARIVATAVWGVEPRIMGIGPVGAVKRLLDLAKVSLREVEVIELNEAFAAQSLACLRELGIEDNDSRVNPNGGAIALGHPLGMSGARLILTATHELQLRKARYAVCTMCVGVGQGAAMLLERM